MKFFRRAPLETIAKTAWCVLCGNEIARDANYRRFVQARGVRVNTIRDTGACSSDCVEKWWSDHATHEELIKPSYQTDERGNLILHPKFGTPLLGVEPIDPAVEMRVYDFVARVPGSLVQLHPTLVFASKDEANKWWNTPESDLEREERTSAQAGKADHREYERVLFGDSPGKSVLIKVDGKR